MNYKRKILILVFILILFSIICMGGESVVPDLPSDPESPISSPTTGLSTTYTAPSVSGKRNITAQYNNLKTGATIIVVRDD